MEHVSRRLFSPFRRFVLDTLRFFGGSGILLKNVFVDMLTPPRYHALLIEQIYHVGQKSLPLIIVTACSIGMVISLQFGLGLEKFGGKFYAPKVVAISVLREIGPMFTSLMFAARVGAGMTAEIGSMVVTQQIDAIRALGTNPIKRIVIPRVLACIIAIPILSSIANLIGNIGGLIVGVTELNLEPNFYLLKILTTVTLKDYLSGFFKTFFFAIFISITACFFGLNVGQGTKAVGLATTKSVVVSSILILVGDYFLSKMFWIFEKLL